MTGDWGLLTDFDEPNRVDRKKEVIVYYPDRREEMKVEIGQICGRRTGLW